MGRVLLTASLVGMVLCFESAALAHAPPSEAALNGEARTSASPGALHIDQELQYYGWQSLLADALVFGLGTAVHPLAFVLIVSTGPVVHAVNRNFLMMGISAGVRGVGALLFLIGGIQALSGWGHYDSCHEMGEARCEPEPADGTAFFVAGGILMAGAVIMDAVFGVRRPRKPRATAFQVQPFVSPLERAGGLALAGAF